MDVADVLSSGGLVISGAAVAKLADVVIRAWSARNQKTEVSGQTNGQAVRVVEEPRYVRESDLAKALESQDKLNREVFGRLGNVEQRVASAEGCSEVINKNVATLMDDVKKILRDMPRKSHGGE